MSGKETNQKDDKERTRTRYVDKLELEVDNQLMESLGTYLADGERLGDVDLGEYASLLDANAELEDDRLAEEFGKRLRQARNELSHQTGKKVTQPMLAQMCEWEDGQARISNYENGKREPSLADVATLAKALNVPYTWLLTGYPKKDEWLIQKEKLEKLIENVPREPLLGKVKVPEFSISASMGNGSENHDEEITTYWTIDEKMIARFGIPNGCAAIVPVEGNSMLDTLKDGDFVLVDRQPVKRLEGKIYILWSRTGLKAKRVIQRDHDGTIEVISDNPDKDLFPTKSYEPETFDEVYKVKGTVIRLFLGSLS